jgi:hypothetical protein
MSRSLVDRLLGQPTDARQALAEMRRRRLNFDPSLRHTYTPENGWYADDVRRPLPPGDPLPHGSWESARRIARDYDFADPSIVRGVFDREEPLARGTAPRRDHQRPACPSSSRAPRRGGSSRSEKYESRDGNLDLHEPEPTENH